MSSADCSQANTDILSNIMDGKIVPSLCGQFLTSRTIDGQHKELLSDFLKLCDKYVKVIQTKEGYAYSTTNKSEVSNTCQEAYFILKKEPDNINYMLDSILYSLSVLFKNIKSHPILSLRNLA